MKIKINKLNCKRCGHQWIPRKECVGRCPRCQSPYWNMEKEKNSETYQPIYYNFLWRDLRAEEKILISIFGKSSYGLYTPLSEDNFRKLQDVLSQLLSKLPYSRGSYIVKKRYGLNGNKRHTLDEVGKELKITRERVRQIEYKTFRLLRHPTYSETLKPFLTIFEQKEIKEED